MKNKRNRVDVTIGGTDYSKYLCLPFVVQDTGTEQLDSAIIELRGMRTDAKFRPFEAVSLCGGKYTYVVADDTVTEVYGRGLCNHEITLIDATKMTERILMEAKNFTQPLTRNVVEGTSANVYFIQDSQLGSINLSWWDSTSVKVDRTYYKTPQILPRVVHEYGVQIFSIEKIKAMHGGLDDFWGQFYGDWKISVYYNATQSAISPSVDLDVFETIREPMVIERDKLGTDFYFEAYKTGVYTVRYEVQNITGTTMHVAVPLSIYDSTEYSIKNYTIKDVLEILLDTAKPLFGNEEAEYKLDLTTEQLQKWSDMESPEFHFANGRSLYENLKEVGDFLHALPKVKIEGGQKKIYFQELGKREPASIKGVPYGNRQQFSVADYANAVEANFANLINAVDENDGSVVEPYQGGFITLRSDSYRIKEEDSYIPTAFPIGSKVTKVIVSNVYGVTGTDKEKCKDVEITPAIYEENAYLLLSSFSGSFPSSRTCALYYKTGERNIQGLWYRAEEKALDILNSLQRYSITNILNYFGGHDYSSYDYTSLQFQVTYIPFIDGRARQERTEFLGGDRMILAHNQSANQLSASAFGESLRGKVAMLANPSESKQYLFASIDDVPRAGDMIGDKNFISLVTTRVFPDFCISQIDLTENYNNSGAYAQLKTGIRQYEIPEGELRHTLVEEFCVIGEKEDVQVDNNLLCQTKFRRDTVGAFAAWQTNDISIARVSTYDDNGSTIAQDIALPVYSAALGNSVYFGFRFEDNYKAGARSIDIGMPSARGTQYVEYSSQNYARAKKLGFTLYGKLSTAIETHFDTPNTLPVVNGGIFEESDAYISTDVAGLMVWNKDAADSASLAYQIHFCSNDRYVITSELSKMMPYIRTSLGEYKNEPIYAYFYDGEIDEVTGIPRGNELNTGKRVDYDRDNLCLTIEPISAPYKSFILARQDRKCIIGKNTDNAPEKIYFNFKRKRG